MARFGWSACSRRRRRPQASCTTEACPAGREKVPVCQRETVGLAKAGRRAFRNKLQNLGCKISAKALAAEPPRISGR